jgi:hypothetical protein
MDELLTKCILYNLMNIPKIHFFVFHNFEMKLFKEVIYLLE